LYFLQLLESKKVKCQLVDIGEEKWPDGQTLPLPPVLLGQLGDDPNKKTLCVYGHLDVQPAAREDGWNTDPFVLTEIDGKLYGRGATDDKGPVMGWFNTIDAYQRLGIDIPINLKVNFCLLGEKLKFFNYSFLPDFRLKLRINESILVLLD
jgi:nonspecific dipeptidase